MISGGTRQQRVGDVIDDIKRWWDPPQDRGLPEWGTIGQSFLVVLGVIAVVFVADKVIP